MAHARRKFYEARHHRRCGQHPGLGVYPATVRCGGSGPGTLAAGEMPIHGNTAAQLASRASALAAGTLRAASGAVQDLVGSPASAAMAAPARYCPKSPMGQAITYALNQWDALCVYTTNGILAIDNNVSENALRRVALGRKNWNFLGSDNGGATAAILFSLIATCQPYKVNAFEYLRDVLAPNRRAPHATVGRTVAGSSGRRPPRYRVPISLPSITDPSIPSRNIMQPTCPRRKFLPCYSPDAYSCNYSAGPTLVSQPCARRKLRFFSQLNGR